MSTMKARLAATSAAMFLLAGGLTAASALQAAAATCGSGVPGDVNGDGHGRLRLAKTAPSDRSGAQFTCSTAAPRG